MPTLTRIHELVVPLGRQQIVLENLVHDAGGMALLRVRIRERTRFTVLDIDPASARLWGEAMVRWSASQPPDPSADAR